MILPRTDIPYSATHPHFGHSSHPPYGATHPHFGHSPKRLSVGAIVGIVIACVFVVGVIAWVIRTFLRHRALGLQRPTIHSFLPCLPGKPRGGSYEPTRPAASGAGGLFGFLKPSRGGYTGANERSARARSAFDEGAWDSRMDHEETTEYQGASQGVKEAVIGALAPRSREQDLGVGREEDRGRSRNRGAEVYVDYGDEPTVAGKNPFDQDVVRKDGFGDVRIQGGRPSVDSSRRSAFREAM